MQAMTVTTTGEFRALARALVGLSCAALIAACGGGGGGDSPVPLSSPPAISTQPVSQSVLSGAVVTFSVTAAGSGLSYQWKRNGTAIAGATAADYQTPAVTHLDNGALYTVTVTNVDGSATSTAAQLTLTSSADQQVFENLALTGGGSHRLHWNLNYAGGQTSGTNYATSDYSVLNHSPLTSGPQSVAQSALINLATTLALKTNGPTRVFRNGAVLVVPTSQQSSTISYSGNHVHVDVMAADNATLVYSEVRNNFTSVPLTGALSADTSDFAHWHNSFFSNMAVFKAGSQYAAGAGYVKYTATSKGDRYYALDCAAVTVDANVSPCLSSTTLTAALTTGIASASDGVTHRLADGIVSMIGGVPVWVAALARPQSATLSSTVQYRFYYELHGNVYTGSLVRDNTVLGGSYYVSNPAGATVTERLTFLPFHVRMNKAARDSIAAAMAI